MREGKRGLVSAVCFALIPLLGCVVFAAVQGLPLWRIDPIASYWNDEVFYYKQIEGIIGYGMPQGYFGYNESVAQMGTLGAWSLFLLLPYALLGRLFGFSPMHMLAFNLLVMCLSFLVFWLLARPDVKRTIRLALAFLAVPVYLRFIISGMVEAVIFALTVVMAGLCVRLVKRGGLGTTLAFYLVVLYLALCRPYFIIFAVIPFYYQYKKSRGQALLCGALTGAVFLSAYLLFVLPHTAAYFFPIINTEIFTVLATQGFLPFIESVFLRLYEGLKLIALLMIGIVLEADMVSSIYCLFFLLVTTAFALLCANLIRRRRNEEHAPCAPLLLSLLICAAVMLAIIFFYSILTGSRHLMALYLFVMLLVLSMYPLSRKSFIVVLLLTCLLSSRSLGEEYSFWLPHSDGSQTEESVVIGDDAQLLSEVVSIDETADRWDNTVALHLGAADWHYCYYLPKGVGIEIVYDDYLLANKETLKSRYVLTGSGAKLEEVFSQPDWEQIASGQEYALYRRMG